MSAYVLRRLLQMVPTLLGVLLITFVLFNVVGGSPAAMTLGERASPQALEDYDEVRGFNKPLIAGLWSATRLHPDGPPRFAGGSAPADGPVRLGPGEHRFALAFPPRPGAVYRIEVEWRAVGPAAAELRAGPVFQALEEPGGSSSKGWKTTALLFRSPPGAGDGAAAGPVLQVRTGGIEVRAARVRRRAAHPFDSQLAHYLGRLARLDLGVSSRENRRVAELLREGIGPSLALTVPIFIIELILAVLIALISAYWRDSWLDRGLVTLSVALMSISYLVYILVGQYLLAYRWNLFPVWGWESWRNLLLPVLVGVVSGLGGSVRFYRTVFLNEMYRDHVRTARAKGCGPWRILLRHVLANALVPIITRVAVTLPFLYTGSLLLESFFGIPGLGFAGVNALANADLQLLKALVLVGSFLFVAANLLADLAYAWADPRIRLH